MRFKIKRWKPYMICIAMFLLSCNENTKKKQDSITPKKEIIAYQNQIAKNTSGAKKDFTKLKSKSFVISCGGGCAMTYDVKKISQTNALVIRVTFKVAMYIDQEPSETFEEIYIFSYHNDHKIEKITRENEKENILENLTGGAQQTFKGFAEELIDENI